MAASEHGTLSAGVVTAVTIDTSAKGFEVVNRDQTGEIWVRVDGGEPEPRGAGSFVVLGARRFGGSNRAGPVTIKLIAEADRQFSVEGAAA
jgi:hypothetical protein